MNRIRALVLVTALLVCSFPLLTATANAAEVDDNLDVYIDDYYTSMDGLSGLNDIITEEKVEEITEYLSELLNLDALKAAGNAINVFFENTYISRVFFTAFLMSLISFIMRGN